jgi:hypothetical protein
MAHNHSLSAHTHTVGGSVAIYDSGSSGNWGLIATNQTGNLNAFIQQTVTTPTGGPSSDSTGSSSAANTGGTGSGTAYFQPFVAVNYIIKHD